MSLFFFYFFAAILIAACLSVVLARHPLYNVLSLVVAIFALSCLFVLLEAYFVGMVLLLVYAGAVLVFFLFVVMCLNLNALPLMQPAQKQLQWFGALGGLMFAGTFLLAMKSFLAARAMGPSSIRGTIEAVGKILFTNYLLPFELTSLLLLVAVFGIVSLAQGALSTGKER
ncbi:MAG: NADH-quinone oxidoreductase subunit J [Candidatus Omnitrophica bacterium]|nr:NADH-quinone oxidoreductase subunit J [Candidatus Omnitrophota bacterium]MDE2010077.1 NADH-quinone oxidoreductase subunit J [Candidatus Omnitrophota bacterium]MDE2215183.1 NADH-quinone oxidoreductase subunit J [Candidatus Omnitrophota bacterium]MDE2232084.1 NADH-quinone oxidoreductase subunit J [Candidatus Omnitrophota bacterium]